jgi:hypothetical protein
MGYKNEGLVFLCIKSRLIYELVDRVCALIVERFDLGMSSVGSLVVRCL